MPYITESFGRGRVVDTILEDAVVPFSLRVSKLPVEENQWITISPDTTNEELFYYTTSTGTVGEAGTLLITRRGTNVTTDSDNVINQREHEENSEYKLALNHVIINNKADLDEAYFTKILGFPVFANAAARDAAITAPIDGLIAYLNDIEDFCSYKNGVWINGLGGGGSATFYQDSTSDGTLVGAVDGINTSYLMSNAPASPMAVTVVYNGVVQELGATDDYTILGQTITFNVAPVSGKILAIYPDSPIAGGNAKTRAIPNTSSVNGELYRSTDDTNSLYYKDNGGDVIKLIDITTNKIPTATLNINPAVDYQASDTIAGFAERATDTEALAGVDTTRFITSKQAKDNYTPISSGVTFTRDVSLASGTQVINHSLGKIPTNITFHNTTTANFSGAATLLWSTGHYDGVNNNCIFVGDTNGTIITNTSCIAGNSVSNSKSYVGAITSMTTTTFTITWTKGGLPTGIFNILAIIN